MDSAYSGEDKKSAGQTLSFFSQQIWKNEINKSHTEIRNEIINHLQKNLDRNDIVFGKSENNGISEHYVRITNSKAQTIDKWKIICSFLERRMINSSGNSYLESYRILLTLKPTVATQYQRNNNMSKDILQDSLSILEKIPEQIVVNVFGTDLVFSPLPLEDEIETNSWGVIIGRNRRAILGEIIGNQFETIKSVDAESRKDYSSAGIRYYLLNNVPNVVQEKLKDIFKYSGIHFEPATFDPGILLMQLYGTSAGDSAIFGSFPNDGSDTYFKWKLETIKRGISSQNILPGSSINPAKFQTIKLEVMHKLGMRPLELDTSQENPDIDGFIYISRVNEWLDNDDPDKQKYKNILGSVIVYGKRSGESEETILTINDPPSNSNTDGILINSEEKVALALSDGMSLNGYVFNILVTQRPSQEKLKELIDKLLERDIKIGKVFYFSTSYSCAPSDPERIEGRNSDKLSYKILDEKHLFYQPSQRVFGLYDLGTAYCELLYPLNSSFTKNDVISIVRLSKRRLYRIYNIPSLRIPEPIIVFKNKSKLIAEIGGIGGTFPLRLFI